MKPVKSAANLCLIGLLLILCVNFSEAGRRRRNNWRHNIEIYHPKGLMVWYPKMPEVVMVGIEIYLNSRSMATCDICLNTTDTTYGKFILRDDDAIIRDGDYLEYKVIKQKVNGEAYIAKTDNFFVAASRIIPQKVECSASSETIKSNSTVVTLQKKIEVLQDVVYDMFQHCNNITRASKNLYLNLRPMETRLDTKGLFNYTLSMLKEIIPSIDWDNVLIHAYYYDDGVAFEVKTFVDKLIVLQMSKNFTQFTISDLDDMDWSDTDNDVYNA